MSIEEIEVATEPGADLTIRTILAMRHEISRLMESTANVSKLYETLAIENGIEPVVD